MNDSISDVPGEADSDSEIVTSASIVAVASSDELTTRMMDLALRADQLSVSTKPAGETSAEGPTDADLFQLDAELQRLREGILPLGSLEAGMKHLEFILDHIEEARTVDERVKLKVQLIAREMEIATATHDASVDLRRAEAQIAQLQAKAQLSDVETRALRSATFGTVDKGLMESEARVHAVTRSNDLDRHSLFQSEIAEQLQARRDQLQLRARAARFVERARAVREFRSALSDRSWFFRHWKAIVICLVVVSNIVADTPGYTDIPVLAQVNDLWDWAIKPLTAGLSHTRQHLWVIVMSHVSK